jgi:hypothetical protein
MGGIELYNLHVQYTKKTKVDSNALTIQRLNGFESGYRFAMEIMNNNSNLRSKKQFPEPFNYLGYCTWNAMCDQMEVSKTIVVDYFTRRNFPLHTLIIDDGWPGICNRYLRPAGF